MVSMIRALALGSVGLRFESQCWQLFSIEVPQETVKQMLLGLFSFTVVLNFCTSKKLLKSWA